MSQHLTRGAATQSNANRIGQRSPTTPPTADIQLQRTTCDSPEYVSVDFLGTSGQPFCVVENTERGLQ
eukprot:2743205-Pyramimonas_sp.AAC.1